MSAVRILCFYSLLMACIHASLIGGELLLMEGRGGREGEGEEGRGAEGRMAWIATLCLWKLYRRNYTTTM